MALKSLLTALYSRFTATSGSPATHNSLYTALSGHLYNTVAPQKATLPYGVFLLVSGVPEWTFTENMENCLIQFSLFDDSTSASNICDAYDALTALYDDCQLTISGYSHLYMQRQSQQLIREEEDPGTWHYIIEYRIMMEKS